MPSAGVLFCLASAAAFGAMGDLRQARVRRGRDGGDAAGRPVRARRGAAAGSSSPRGRPRAICARSPAATSGSRSRSAPSATARRPAPTSPRCERHRRLAARAARLHVPGHGDGGRGRARARAREPAHGGRAGARLGRARARPGRRGRGRPGPARHRARARRRASSTAPTSSSPRASPRRVGAARLSTLVCTGAATTLTLGGARGRRSDPGGVSAAGLRVARRASPSCRPSARSRCSSPGCGGSGPTAASILSTLEPVVTVGLAFARVRRVARPRPARRRRARARRRSWRSARRPRPPSPRGGAMTHAGPLDGKVALVAGATRGAGRGIAVALGEAGATVYCTGRSTARAALGVRPAGDDRGDRRAGRPPRAAPGSRWRSTISSRTQVEALVQRIDAEHGRLDILVNDIWGGEQLFEWNTPVWEHDLENGLRLLRLAIDTHLITSHFALPLLIREPGGLVVEMTDGTREYNADALPGLGVLRPGQDRRHPARVRAGRRSSRRTAAPPSALTPGWLRSEMMLENYGVTEANWRDGAAVNPHFAAISESPRFVGRAVAALAADPDVAAPQRRLVLLRRARARVRLHRRRRLAARLLALHGRGAGRRAARRTRPATAEPAGLRCRREADQLRRAARSSRARTTTSSGRRRRSTWPPTTRISSAR